MSKKFEPLNSGEVILVDDAFQFLIGHSTFRIDEFTETLKQQLLEHKIGGLTKDKDAWFGEEGVDCQVLKFGSTGWRRGKVRIHLEFCPQDADDAISSQGTSQEQNFAIGQSIDTTSPYEESGLPNGEASSTAQANLDVDLGTTAVAAGGIAAAVVTEPEVASAEEELEFAGSWGEEESLQSTANFPAGEELDLDTTQLDWEENSANSETVESLASDELNLGDEFAGAEELNWEENDSSQIESAEMPLSESWETQTEAPPEEDLDTSASLDFSDAQTDGLNLGDEFAGAEELNWEENDSSQIESAEIPLSESWETQTEAPLEEDLGATQEAMDLGDGFEDAQEIDWQENSSPTQEELTDFEMETVNVENEEFDIEDAFGTQEDLDVETVSTDSEEFNIADAFGGEEDFDLEAVSAQTEEFDLAATFNDEQDLNLAEFEDDASSLDLGDTMPVMEEDIDLERIAQVSEDFDLDGFSADDVEDPQSKEILVDDVWQDISEVK